MNGEDRFVEQSVTAEEVQAARALADVIEGKAEDGADVEALAVVRLFEALSASATDETATRRLRNELAARATRRPRAGLARHAAAIAAGIGFAALLGALLLRSSVRTRESVLAAREGAARAAVAEVAGSWGSTVESSRRIVAVSERQWSFRLSDQLDSERLEQLAGGSSAGSTNSRGPAAPALTRTVPTPGGPS